MSPIFYEDSLGEKLMDMATDAMDAARAADPDSDAALVDDPAALAAAEAAARGEDPQDDYAQVTDDWVPLMGPSKLSGILDSAGFNASLIVAPLNAAGIPHAWDPYPPEEMPAFRVAYGAVDRPFTLLVPPDRREEAARLLDVRPGSPSIIGVPAELPHSDDGRFTRIHWVVWLLVILVGIDLVLTVVSLVLSRLHLL